MKDININISDDDFNRPQKVADIMFNNDLTPKRVDLKKRADMQYLQKAMEELSKEKSKEDNIVVKGGKKR